MRHKLAVLIIIIACLWLVRGLFSSGLPVSHDGSSHIARMANYYLAVKEGQFPPRWAPNLDAGYGYPVLNFNYPLANMISVPLIAVNLGVENTYKLILIVGYVMGGIGIYYFLVKKFGISAALFGALLYVSAPYQLTTIFVRGGVGEILSLALLPWVLVWIDKLVDKNGQKHWLGTTLLLSALWLSHNIMAVISTGLALFYTMVLYGGKGVKRLVKPLLVSALLVSFFWIPALVELKETVMAESGLNTEYVNHFATLNQLLFSPFSFGFSEPGPVDGLTMNVGVVQLVVVLIGVIITLIIKQSSKLWWWGILVFAVSVFMMLSESEFIWSAITYSGFIQFPWRLLFPIVLVAAILAANAYQKIEKKRLLWAVLIMSLVMVSKVSLVEERFVGDDTYWFTHALTTTVRQEIDPINYSRGAALEFFEKSSDKIKLLEGEMKSSTIDKWTGSHHEYEVVVDEQVTMVEKTTFFPGWEVTVNGRDQEILVDRNKSFGLIAHSLPAGVHKVETRFTQKTPSRIVGNSLSLLGVLGLGVEVVRRQYGQRMA